MLEFQINLKKERLEPHSSSTTIAIQKIIEVIL
jgi:hypothetical protein